MSIRHELAAHDSLLQDNMMLFVWTQNVHHRSPEMVSVLNNCVLV